MSVLSGVSEFFGLDIGTTAARAVQLKGNGPVKALDRYGSINLEGTTAISDATVDKQKVMQSINELIRQVGISTKNVAVNLPSNRVFTAAVDWDKLSPDELAKTLRYQADSIIPTPLAESKIDWAMIGDSPKDPKKKDEVLITSVANSYIVDRLNMLESIGLNVIAFEPDSIALARAVLPADSQAPQLILDIGNAATDLVIAMNGAPRLVRSIPIGAQAIIRSAVQNLSVDAAQAAEQFVYKFGLSRDKLDGQVYNAIIGTIDSLAMEIEKSIKFFEGRYPTMRLEHIIVTGGASSLPGFPLYIANKFGISVEIGSAWRNVSFPATKENELMAVSNHFAVAVGLAERKE